MALGRSGRYEYMYRESPMWFERFCRCSGMVQRKPVLMNPSTLHPLDCPASYTTQCLTEQKRNTRQNQKPPNNPRSLSTIVYNNSPTSPILFKGFEHNFQFLLPIILLRS